MCLQHRLGALCAAAILSCALSALADKTQTFNSAASAAAAGWVASGSGVDGQTAGFIATNDAGGAAAGEAQFDVFRGAELSYLDTNLGLVINGTGGFSMTGKVNLTSVVNVPDLGFHPFIGFSSGPSDYLGIMFRGDPDDLGTEVSWGLRFENTGDGIRINSGGDFSRVMSVNTPRTFSMVFDPNAGTNGEITVSVSDAGNPIVHALSATNRFLLEQASYTRFGMLHQANGPNPNGQLLRFDDLTYTGTEVIVPNVNGDYSGNLVVDAADYTVWRDTLGATGANLPADGDGNLVIDQADYDFWKTRFGNTSASAAIATSAVPEPATVISVIVGLLACGGFLRAKHEQR